MADFYEHLSAQALAQASLAWTHHYTEMRFASFLSGGFITAIVVNPL